MCSSYESPLRPLLSTAGLTWCSIGSEKLYAIHIGKVGTVPFGPGPFFRGDVFCSGGRVLDLVFVVGERTVGSLGLCCFESGGLRFLFGISGGLVWFDLT